MTNIVINFKRIKWCFNNYNNNNNKKRLSCMVYLAIHKGFIIIKTPFYPFKTYICNICIYIFFLSSSDIL